MEKKKENKTGLILLGIMIGYTIIYADKQMISLTIEPMTGIFDFNSGQTGLIMGIYFLSYSICQSISGYMADRIGSKRVLIFSLLASGACAVLFGAMSSLVLFCVLRLFMGAAHAGYPPGTTRAVADNFPREKRAFAQTLIMATSGIGGIVAFLVGSPLIAKKWSYGYLFLGVFYLVAAVLLFVFLPKAPKAQTSEKSGESIFKTLGKTLSQILSNNQVRLLCLAGFLFNFTAYGAMSWIPTYLRAELGLGMKESGYLLAVIAVISTLGAFGMSLLMRKTLVGKEKAFTAICAFLVAVTFVLTAFIRNLVFVSILLVLINIFIISILSSITSWPHSMIPEDKIAASSGIITGIGTLGGFFAPIILGLILDSTNNSFATTFLVLAGTAVICGVVVMNLSREIQDI